MKVIPKFLPLLSDLSKPGSFNGQSSAVRVHAKKSGNKIIRPQVLYEPYAGCSGIAICLPDAAEQNAL
jgi:hypothetical protein